MLVELERVQCGNYMLKQSTSSKALVRFPVSHAVVSFPDEKTTDSIRLQMLRGKPPSTTKIAALIPIVKKKL